ASAIHQRRQQIVGCSKLPDDRHRLLMRKHHRQARRTLGPDRLANIAQGSLKYTGVEKHDGIQCQILCGRRHLALAGEPAQKLIDLGRPQLQWMTHLVKPQVKAYPVPVTFLGADAVVMCTHQGVKLLLQARLGWLAVHVIPFTGFLYSGNRLAKDICQANTAEGTSTQPMSCFTRGSISKATPDFRSYIERDRYVLTQHAV